MSSTTATNTTTATEVEASFRSAALAVTQLFRASQSASKAAFDDGFSACLAELVASLLAVNCDRRREDVGLRTVLLRFLSSHSHSIGLTVAEIEAALVRLDSHSHANTTAPAFAFVAQPSATRADEFVKTTTASAASKNRNSNARRRNTTTTNNDDISAVFTGIDFGSLALGFPLVSENGSAKPAFSFSSNNGSISVTPSPTISTGDGAVSVSSLAADCGHPQQKIVINTTSYVTTPDMTRDDSALSLFPSLPVSNTSTSSATSTAPFNLKRRWHDSTLTQDAPSSLLSGLSFLSSSTTTSTPPTVSSNAVRRHTSDRTIDDDSNTVLSRDQFLTMDNNDEPMDVSSEYSSLHPHSSKRLRWRHNASIQDAAHQHNLSPDGEMSD
ncbi:hypothetical protein BC830DRAFT_632706 [Chytriomyces sp. MP71]|nr:hypothetical protein BC830DRAFT_632706 [Chytriomyces sp. MP71]